MHPMLTIAIQAAREVSHCLLRSLDHLESIALGDKKRQQFMHQLYDAADQTLVQHLTKSYQDHQIKSPLSEHGEASDYLWLNNPISGFDNLLHGIPHFATSIALVFKGELEVGVIYDPLRDELFTAVNGQNTQLNNKRVRTSGSKILEQSLLATAMPHDQAHHLEAHFKLIKHLTHQNTLIRETGNLALDLAYLSCGRIDGFWDVDIDLFDSAAGILMVQEAGGITTGLHGEKNNLEHSHLLAACPKLHKPLSDSIELALSK